MRPLDETALAAVLADVAAERRRQHAKWGEQTLPDGTGGPELEAVVVMARDACSEARRDGSVAWIDVLSEEVAEALAETDPACLRAELVQVAAVAAQWIEAIDRRLP